MGNNSNIKKTGYNTAFVDLTQVLV